MKKLLIILLSIILFAEANAGKVKKSTIDEKSKVWGVTIDAINNLNSIVASLQRLPKKMTTRIVFDEWIPATTYVNAVNQISQVSKIMGEILDSYYMSQYNQQQFTNRVNEYVNTLGDKVNIWEIGNEINGEWLGSTSSVVAKMTAAYDIVKSQNKVTALTFYYNYNCWENHKNEMFYWINKNVPAYMRNGLDYVWVSYYEDDCNNYQPNWQKVFDSLHVLFPNSKIGIGECGTNKSNKKVQYMTRYYTMNITTPNYVGGYFWWYYKQDCVPHTKALWTTLFEILLANNPNPGLTADKIESNTEFSLSNFPNPFNPVTSIYYKIPESGDVRLSVFDGAGREVSVLVNEYKNDGKYIVDFNGSSLSSGIYFCRLSSSNGKYVKINKIILLK